MERWLTEQDIDCPYCAERITLLIDATAGSQEYVEDCQVCCRPIEVSVRADGGVLSDVEVSDAS